jgi:hypothetical protein
MVPEETQRLAPEHLALLQQPFPRSEDLIPIPGDVEDDPILFAPMAEMTFGFISITVPAVQDMHRFLSHFVQYVPTPVTVLYTGEDFWYLPEYDISVFQQAGPGAGTMVTLLSSIKSAFDINLIYLGAFQNIFDVNDTIAIFQSMSTLTEFLAVDLLDLDEDSSSSSSTTTDDSDSDFHSEDNNILLNHTPEPPAR